MIFVSMLNSILMTANQDLKFIYININSISVLICVFKFKFSNHIIISYNRKHLSRNAFNREKNCFFYIVVLNIHTVCMVYDIL